MENLSRNINIFQIESRCEGLQESEWSDFRRYYNAHAAVVHSSNFLGIESFGAEKGWRVTKSFAKTSLQIKGFFYDFA
jgi:hypothetical protein